LNWQEQRSRRSFFPEDPVKQTVAGRSSGSPPFLMPSRPSIADSGCGSKRFCKAYSSGDCSGFTPDSLIKALPDNRKANHHNNAKVKNYLATVQFELKRLK
jgi:hypothetical protein